MSVAVIDDRSDLGEWMLAFVVSVLINLLAVPLMIGLMASVSTVEPDAVAVPSPDPVAMIYPEMLQPEVAEPEDAPTDKPFMHTAPDQEAGKSEQPRYIGERDTVAAADKAAAEDDLLVPTQDGREVRKDGDIETVSRDYQDGSLDHADDGNPAEPARPAPPVKPAESAAAEPAVEEMPEYVQEAPKRERLAEGPNPVDRPLPPDEAREAEEMRRAAQPPQPEEQVETQPKPAVPVGGKPGFRGNQIKTRLKGAISRRGTSSLDVENNAVGRYQAALNRAVEREWQRNCVRYRDFITPGFLTLRFMVQADGGVRSIEFLEVVEAGEIQKGFTLNSVRSAPIPPMPAELKRQLDGDPLELIYNFYF